MRVLFFLIASLCFSTLHTQVLFSGILQQSEAGFEYGENLSWETLQATHAEYSAKGYRLSDIESALVNGERRYWAVFMKSDISDSLIQVLGWAEFIKKRREMAAAGYQITDLEAHAVSEEDFVITGTWRKGKTVNKVWKVDTKEGLVQKTEEMAKDKFYLIGIEPFTTPGQITKFLAIYEFSAVPALKHLYFSDDLKTFNTDLLQRIKSGYRPIDFEQYDDQGKAYYLGVYRKGAYEARILQGLEEESFKAHWEVAEKEGLRLTSFQLYMPPAAKPRAKPQLTTKGGG